MSADPERGQLRIPSRGQLQLRFSRPHLRQRLVGHHTSRRLWMPETIIKSPAPIARTVTAAGCRIGVIDSSVAPVRAPSIGSDAD